MLTERQADFVRHYLVSLNAADAARRAGFSEKAARQQGSRLLQDPDVARAIREARAAVADRQEVTLDSLVRELKAIAFLDPRALYDWGPDDVLVKPSTVLTDSEARTVAEVQLTVSPSGRTVKVKSYDKMAAFRLLKELLSLGAPPPDDGRSRDDGEDIGDDPDPPVAPEGP